MGKLGFVIYIIGVIYFITQGVNIFEALIWPVIMAIILLCLAVLVRTK
jgi:hypothetical protein